MAGVVASLVWTLAQQGESAELQREVEELRQQLQSSRAEVTQLKAATGTEQSTAQVEKAAQRQLQARLKALEAENEGLKEDVALFERLMPAAGDESSVRVERVLVTADQDSGRYRYRLLVGFSPSKQVRDFKGRLQLVVSFQSGGREQQLVLPASRDSLADYQVEVRHFLRKEGRFAVPPGARLLSVEAQLFQGDALKARRLAQL